MCQNLKKSFRRQKVNCHKLYSEKCYLNSRLCLHGKLLLASLTSTSGFTHSSQHFVLKSPSVYFPVSFSNHLKQKTDRGNTVVKVLCYNSEGTYIKGTAVAQWLSCCATNRKVHI